MNTGDSVNNRYMLLQLIAKNVYFEVWKAQDCKVGTIVTLKLFHLYGGGRIEYEAWLQGFKHLLSLRHSNLAPVLALDYSDPFICIAMPYYEQRITDKYVDSKETMPEEQCWHLLQDVASGLAYLHSQTPPVCHQHVKSDNVFIDADGNYVLMGLVDPKIHVTAHSNSQDVTNVFSLAFFGPERFRMKPMPILSSDIWSLGVVAYEMMTGMLPFGNEGGVRLLKGDNIPIIYGDYSQGIKSLVYRMLAKEPWERPSAETIIEVCKQRQMPTNDFGSCNSGYPALGCAVNTKRELPNNSIEDETSGSAMDDDKQSVFSTVLRKIKNVFAHNEMRFFRAIIPHGNEDSHSVYSSIYAPAEVKRKTHMLVQVYIHMFSEVENVKKMAQEPQKDAERRDYIPLQRQLNKGDKVDVLFKIQGDTLLMSDKKSIVWQGSFTKCSFDYFVPESIGVDELSCMALLTIGKIPVGEMRFVTKIVDEPRKMSSEIIARKYNKVFVSYSHQDESKVKFLHEGLELGGVPHFFDRHYLKAGDVFPQVIQDYINSADLFILCWSENASKSEYVEKERTYALQRAFPQVKPQHAAKLSMYPICIEPRVELPIDMKDKYVFGMI